MMNQGRSHTRGGSRGFTLIELSILLAVFAIGAAIVVPSFIESARDTLIEKAASDVLRLQDAAKWAYVGSDMTDPGRGRTWPAEFKFFNTRFCIAGSGAMRTALINDGYIDAAAYDNNPWGRAYTLSLASVPPDCFIQVSTQVPANVTAVFLDMLPGSNCGAAVGGWSQCTSRIPRPGDEAYLRQDVTPNLELSQDFCLQMGGVMSAPGGFCRIQNTSTLDTAAACAWHDQGACPPGTVLMSTRCDGKYCTPIDIYCCSMTNY